VAVPGGSELLIHHVNLLLESHPDWVVLKTDIRNAFNSVERAYLLPEVSKAFPDLAHHVFKMYNGSSPLIFYDSHNIHILQSEEGVHQGDPLGPVLFSVALHPFLLDVQRDHPTIRSLAYLDDMFFIGPVDDVLSALSDVETSLHAIGLTISLAKCEIFSNGQALPSFNQPIAVALSGTKILGTPVGKSHYVTSTCLDIAKSGKNLCDQLQALKDPQSGMLLLRHCHVSHINHLSRTVSPSWISDAAHHHDQLTRATFESLINCPGLTDLQWLQATLPIRFGGFGMAEIKSMCHLAFVSSWAYSLAHLPSSFEDLGDQIKVIISQDPHDDNVQPISQSLQNALPQNKNLKDLILNPNKLQHKLSSEHNIQISSSILSNPQSLQDGARMRSLQGKGAGAWLESIPVSTKFALKAGDFCLATRLRLGCDMPLGMVSSFCDCGKTIDKAGYHLLTCKTGGGPIWSHETIVGVWGDCLKQLQIVHHREPRDRYVNSNARADIIAYNAQTGADIELDVSLAHPWAGHIISQAAEEDGVAAARREHEKSRKYAAMVDVWGSPSSCVPLVLEHFGRWGQQALQFLDQLSLQSVDEDGRENGKEFKTFWRRRFSVALQRCNSSVLRRKISRIVTFRNSTHTVHKFDNYSLQLGIR
jgi:hypothetical protein